MPTYKTPDVYVEEISVFPPSVAEVETAVPAFIGYTQSHSYRGEDLELVPTRIDSLLEYNERFGGAPPLNIQNVELDPNNNVVGVTMSANFYMYDSLRMFFQNGGGKCYIISIGTYSDAGNLVTPSKADFEKGLAALKKKDEPTLILLPDAPLIPENGGKHSGLYDLQKLALAQANELGDRFVIMDLAEPPNEWEDKVDEFRNEIGVNYLKYGAAYTPYLKTTLPHVVHYRDLPAALKLKNKTDDPIIGYTIANLEAAIADVNVIKGDDLGGLEDDWQTRVDAFKSAANATDLANSKDAFRALMTFIYETNKTLFDKWIADPPVAGTLSTYGPPPAGAKLPKDMKIRAKELVTNIFNDMLLELNTYNADLSRIDDAANEGLFTVAGNQPTANGTWNVSFTQADYDAAGTHEAITTAAVAKLYPDDTANDDASYIANMKIALFHITDLWRRWQQSLNQILNEAKANEKNFEDALSDQWAVFRNITSGVGNWMSTLPPSGAIAGVYAATDSNRGVWKAPANVSLNAVSAPTIEIDSKEQEELNVDVTAGKSINAIRTFTGKGVLVWGARTLAGNDNEWRYVPVRRFFNMAEESIKKSTSWAVFEPNDAALWVKLRAMIENYLTEKWREGALAGAKPEHAFFVQVGLGVTMSPQDILEGRLIVEIGMAVVRPAEFIILRFSHKMQQS